MKRFLLFIFIAAMITAAVSADTILLKDEQLFEADVVSFDSFYLVVKTAAGKEISIPWKEVRSVKHTTTASSWLEETYMTPEDSGVTTLVTPLSADTAFFRALNPGVIIHGSGHFYAKDTNMGMSLLSAEIVSLIVMGISVGEMLSPVDQDQTYNVSQIVFYSGLAIFGGSWLYDLIFAGPAAARFNSENTFIAGGNGRDADSPGK